MSNPKTLNNDRIFEFLLLHLNDRVSIEGFIYESCKLGGVYWILTAISLLKGNVNGIIHPKTNQTLEVMALDIITASMNKDGAFGYGPKHSSNIIPTHYAILSLSLLNRMDILNREGIIQFIASLQNKDGSFNGDQYGESDCRYSYSAIVCLHCLGGLDRVDMKRALDFILNCNNFDGGFGWQPKTESHGAATFCCIGVLALLNVLDLVDLDNLGFWLCERQTQSGGFNGRPEKAPDLCYSWWILSSLYNIDRISWIDSEKLIEFILESQSDKDGGMSYFPGYMSDVFHTFFGLCALSLIDAKRFNLSQIHPIYSITLESVDNLS